MTTMAMLEDIVAQLGVTMKELAETHKETERSMAKSREEAERAMAKSREETERAMVRRTVLW
jgi:predicted  nucleic acid-binding Zn-ribbon protein